MALTPAEKMRAYRERQKANNQKQVSFLIDADIADTVTSYAEQHQTTQADVFNNLLRQALDGNKLPSNDTVTSYQKEIDRLSAMAINCYQCANWTGESCAKGLTLEGFVCADFNDIQAKLDHLLQRNIELVTERDRLTIENQKLSRITQAIDYKKELDKRTIEDLKKEIDDLNRKLNAGTGKACQCVTSNGTQCTRPAYELIQTNDVLLWVCKQHRTSKYPNAPRA